MRRALRVAVGLSGGVDSSVAALLLKRAGFSVTGVFMRNWDAADESGAGLRAAPCPVEADFSSARAVARALDIPLVRVDFSRAYWTGVFERALADFSRGRTPNPDAACNAFIKFGSFREHALTVLGADVVATGHYAQLWPDAARDAFAALPRAHGGDDTDDGDARAPELFAAVDARKDQSDFLALVPPASLSRVAFPLGRLTKGEVRALAHEARLPSASRAESMGMCFVGERSLPAFLSAYIKPTRADFFALERLSEGGRHVAPLASRACAEAMTVGQGARIAGRAGHAGTALPPYFVAANGLLCSAREDAAVSRVSVPVWVVPGSEHAALFATAAAVDFSAFNWSTGGLPAEVVAAAREASARRGSEDSGAVVSALADWLRAAAEPRGSASMHPSSPLPTPLRVFFRDRHTSSVPRAASVSVIRRAELTAACALIAQKPIYAPIVRTDSLESISFVPGWMAVEEGEDDRLLLTVFDEPHRAVTPGQVLVLYSHKTLGESGGRAVIGGGEVLCAGPSLWEMGLEVRVSGQTNL